MNVDIDNVVEPAEGLLIFCTVRLAIAIPLLIGLVTVKLPVVVCAPPANVIDPDDVVGLIMIPEEGPDDGVGVGATL